MTKRKTFRAFIAIALSLVMLVGIFPAAAMAEGEREILVLEVHHAKSYTPIWWAPAHVFVQGEAVQLSVLAIYSDESQRRLPAEELVFTIGDSEDVLEAEAAGPPGEILLPSTTNLPLGNYTINVALKDDPEVTGHCSVDIDDAAVQTVVPGQEYVMPVLEKGQTVQLVAEVYPPDRTDLVIWADWQQDHPDGKIGTDSYISKDGLLYVGPNETDDHFSIMPPVAHNKQTARVAVCAPAIMIKQGSVTPPCTHTEDEGVITKNADCTTAGEKTFRCTECEEVLRTEAIAKLGHNWDDGVITTPATEEKEGVKTFTCKRCEATDTESIPKLPVTPGNKDAKFLQERADEVLQNGLSKSDLRLDGKTLTLVLDGREFVLSTNAKNRNVSGEIALGDGYYLKFDIKGNGSNVKEFQVYQK